MTSFNPLTAPLEPGTRVLIEANAGTGKTYNIQNLYLRLILEKALEPSQILVVTFTEAATAELRDRIRQNLAATLVALDSGQPPADSTLAAILSATEHSSPDRAATLRLALAAFDEAAIFTIHGFCKRTIDRNAFDSRITFDCELCPSYDDILRDVVADFYRREWYPSNTTSMNVTLGDLLAHAQHVLRAIGSVSIITDESSPDIDAYARLRAFLNDPTHGFATRMRRRQTMGYDDLLRNMRDALADGPECPLARTLRDTYAIAMIDEFQDTDPVQYEIFQTVFAHADSMLFMIGDPKQAIYGFRGGDIYAYLKAKESVAESSQFSLSQNFRSSRELIVAVNDLFAPPGVFIEKGLDYEPSTCGREPKRILLKNGQPDTSPFELLWFTGDAEGKPVASTNLEPDITRFCAARIASLLAADSASFSENGSPPVPVTPGDIAVLTTTNSQAETLQKRLRQHNIPAVIYKAGNIYASEDAGNFWHLLAAMAEPSKPGKIKAALLTPYCGLTIDDLIALESPRDDQPENAASETYTRAFDDFGRLWLKKGIMPALSALFDHFSSLERLTRDPACERRLTNLRHLTELLHQAETASTLRPDTLLSWFKQQLDSPDANDEVHEQRMESDRRAVTLMTIHKSKGLQFPIVFVPYLLAHATQKGLKGNWTVHAPDSHGDMRVVLPVGETAKERLSPARQAENLAEHLRLLYVAVTRAESRCVLLMGTNVNYGRESIQSAVSHLAQMHTAMPPSLTTTDVSLDDLRAKSTTRYAPADTREELAAPPAPPTPPDDWTVLSYSGMTLHETAAPSHLKTDAGADEIAAPAPTAQPQKDLPGGINTGLCIHAILEELDFTRPVDPALIDRHAALFGIYTPEAPFADTRRARIATLLTGTLSRPLPVTGATHTPFPLSSIPSADTRREWEFFFKVPTRIPLKPFIDIGLTFKPNADARRGFMTGSIDLLFRHGDRYFFADWKTDTLADYSPGALGTAMTERNYLFQAIIYAVALHTHLKQSLGNTYDFDRHFGGGYYFFVRGVDAADNGIFSFRPTLAELEHWCSILHSS